MASHASPGQDRASQDGPSRDGPGQDSLARHWRAKRFAYRRHVANMTTYPADVFWMEAEARGFVPLAVRLVPSEPLNGNMNYAYFLLGG